VDVHALVYVIDEHMYSALLTCTLTQPVRLPLSHTRTLISNGLSLSIYIYTYTILCALHTQDGGVKRKIEATVAATVTTAATMFKRAKSLISGAFRQQQQQQQQEEQP
jgi:hypothetical protein